MRTRLSSVITLGLMAFTAMATAVAPGAAQAQEAGNKIAVIDVAYIFKNNEGIKSQISSVEADLKDFETKLKAKRSELQTEAGKLKAFEVGSPDYETQSQKVALLESKLRTEMVRKRKELSDAEAAIYYKNYKLIADTVAKIAKYNKIDIVFRYNSEGMDVEKGDTVLRGVMKNVVYHNADLDFTSAVNDYLTKQLAANGTATRR